MKLLLLSLLFIFNLQADILNNSSGKQSIYDIFSTCSSNINSIIKHGEYDKYALFEQDMILLQNRIKDAQMNDVDKKDLLLNIQKYTTISQHCIKTMVVDAPELGKKYKALSSSSDDFNGRINSTGFMPLIDKWQKLIHIQKKYIKQPSNRLEKEFYKTIDIINIMVVELYLDEEQEEPLLAYLQNYKNYFDDLSRSYKSVRYENIDAIKPLSYQIKSQIKLSIPYNL